MGTGGATGNRAVLDPWLAGLLAGRGAVIAILGCGLYAAAKGHRAFWGSALGALWVIGMLLFYMLPRFEIPVAGFTIAGLFGLAALRDRSKHQVFQRTAR